MGLLDDLRTTVKVSIRERIGHCGEEEDRKTAIDAEFHTMYDLAMDIDEADDYLLAKVECTYLNIDDLDGHVHDFLDMSQGLYELYHPFYSKGRDNRLNSSMSNKFFDPKSANMFVIDQIIVEEPFRGRGVSSEIIDHMIKQYAKNASIAVLKAFPFEYKDKPEFETMQKKLKKHYKEMGFQPVKGTDWMYRDISMKMSADQYLLTAARKGDYEMVVTALDFGANIHAENKRGDTASSLSKVYGHNRVYSYLQNYQKALDEQDELLSGIGSKASQDRSLR